jgi:adenylate kinase
MKILLLMGPPGCGKGTFASMLSNELSCAKITMGDLVRKKLANLSHSGRLVSDDVINDIFYEEYCLHNVDTRLILDGYPRSINQSLFMRSSISEKNLVVFSFEVDYNVLSKRILGRISCGDCSAIFNEYFNPPIDNKCSNCGSSNLHKRKDDTENIFAKRMLEYTKYTVPVIEYYNSIGLVKKIDANAPISALSEKVRSLVAEYFD